MTDLSIEANAADYNASAALSYAAAHWNDGVGLCAEFVSNCLKAGGLESWSTGCTRLMNQLETNSEGVLIRLNTSGNYISAYNNEGNFSLGDPVFWRCDNCNNYMHVGLISGVDSSGYITHYAHNSAQNNKRIWIGNCYDCGRAYSGMYVRHFSGATEPSYADLGDDFYAVILNTAYWKPISQVNNSQKIYLQSEKGISKQIWRFDRQDDGAYVISSCYDGKALEMFSGDTAIHNSVTACNEFWGGYYQQWYLIPQGNGYIFLSKHFTELNRVMELSATTTEDGNKIQINERNNNDSQIWSVYKGNDIQLRATTLSVSQSANIVKFNWPDVYGESRFDLKIWKNNLYDGDAYTIKWDAKSGLEIALPPGTYKAYVDSVNYYQYIMSNVVTITVDECIHSSTEVRNAKTATCTAEGYTGDTYCKTCGTKTKTGSAVAKKAHSYTSSITTQPTCTKEGVRTYKCSCGASYTEKIAKTSHNSNTTIPAVAATCTATGLTEGKKCSVCGTVTVAQQTVAKKAHSYTSSVTTQPTCTKEGVRTYKCSCGDSYTEKIAKKAHTIVTDKAVSATCTKTGLTEGKHCSVCNTVTVAQKTVATVSHIDNNSDYKCDYNCGYEFDKPADPTPSTPDTPSDSADDCSCNCHKGGIAGFFFKIINFFQKLFGMNKVCACGVKH